MRVIHVVTALCVFALGCGPSVTVKQDFDSQANFDSYKTYTWMSEGDMADNIKISAHNHIDLDGEIRKAVDKQMEEKGFTKSKDGQILVAYKVGIRDQVYHRNWGYEYSFMTGTSMTESLQDGALMVDLVDADGAKLVWRGTAYVAVNVDPSPSIVHKNVNKAVKKMFEQYPPKETAAK